MALVSKQWLGNDDQTHLVLDSGKPLHQKRQTKLQELRLYVLASAVANKTIAEDSWKTRFDLCPIDQKSRRTMSNYAAII